MPSRPPGSIPLTAQRPPSFLRLLPPRHFNDVGQLALELGHTDTRVIFQHYRQLVKPREAEKFWAFRLA